MLSSLLQLRQDIVANSRVLIVDDDMLNRKVLRAIFEGYGFLHCDEAEDGQEALEITQRWHPDLIMLDIMMPRMDGHEVCERLRVMRLSPAPVIIAQTALSDVETKVRLFEAGATDYITKPINEHELIARSLAHLEKQWLLRDMISHNSQHEEDLRALSLLHSDIMPEPHHIEALRKNYHLNLGVHVEFNGMPGSTLWGIMPVTDSALAFYLIDFSARGLMAAVHCFRVHALLKEASPPYGSPEAFATWLNDRLCTLLPHGHYAALLYAIYDTEDKRISFVSAGNCFPLIIHGEEGAYHAPSSGLPLACRPGSQYTATALTLATGDSVLLHNDTLLESVDKDGNFFTAAQAIEALSLAPGASAQESLALLVGKLKAHVADQALQDELMLIHLQC